LSFNILLLCPIAEHSDGTLSGAMKWFSTGAICNITTCDSFTSLSRNWTRLAVVWIGSTTLSHWATVASYVV